MSFGRCPNNTSFDIRVCIRALCGRDSHFVVLAGLLGTCCGVLQDLIELKVLEDLDEQLLCVL